MDIVLLQIGKSDSEEICGDWSSGAEQDVMAEVSSYRWFCRWSVGQFIMFQCYLLVCQLSSILLSLCTPQVKKVGKLIFCHNFTKCWPVF